MVRVTMRRDIMPRQQLISWMRKARLSAYEFSRQAGISQGTLSRILSGETTNPQRITQYKIAQFTKRKVVWS